MQFTRLTLNQRGFSLPEVLCALVLFTIVITTLTNFHSVLQQSFLRQWQTRELWRYAHEQIETEALPLPDTWHMTKHQTLVRGCANIRVNLTSPSGGTGQLHNLRCSEPERYRE